MRPRRIALLAIAAAGCTLVVGGDPRIEDVDASAGADAAKEHDSGADAVAVADAKPKTPEASACDASPCYAAKDACKKTCANVAAACNAACNQDDSKTCKKLCQQQLSSCNDACLATCDLCVSGCAGPCSL